MQITLLRHGKPNFEWSGCVTARDIGYIIKAYDMAVIIGTPPQTAKLLTRNHDFIVCSNLPRSLESAKTIGATTIPISDSIFREMNIPTYNISSIKLPVLLWISILRGLWFLGFSKNTESISISRQRAKLASEKLIELAEQHEKVLLVGHGFINHYIAKELLISGWLGPSNPGRKHWEFGTYQYNKD